MHSDIPHIAEMLASAVVRDRADVGVTGAWRHRMNQLFAKADIESLLRGRLYAIEEGESSWKRICELYADETEENRVKVFWSTNERFRVLVEKASSNTGEDNLWKRHNFYLTPGDVNWFNHLQLTAVDVTTGTVAGFCEVAMLSNPAKDGTCSVTTATVDSDDGDDAEEDRSFSPGITNLVTAQAYRRQGIASGLLQLTERYVRRYWKGEYINLYVEKTNDAAMSLYSSLGYTSTVTCDGGDMLGEMWYMVKDLQSPTRTRQKERELVARG